MFPREYPFGSLSLNPLRQTARAIAVKVSKAVGSSIRNIWNLKSLGVLLLCVCFWVSEFQCSVLWFTPEVGDAQAVYGGGKCFKEVYEILALSTCSSLSDFLTRRQPKQQIATDWLQRQIWESRCFQTQRRSAEIETMTLFYLFWGC